MNETSYGQCRCCLVSGYHKNMTAEYADQRETYIDMFLECFNLFLSTNSDLTCLICKSCIEELHRADKFKAMVIQNEQKLLALSSNKDVIYINLPRPIESDVDLKVETVKSEPLSDNEQMEIDNESDHSFISDGNDLDDAVDYIEGESELLARFPDITKLPIRDTLYTNGCAGYVKHLDLLKGKLISTRMISNLIQDAERASSGRKVYITEKTAQILNTSVVLENSNVTPFKSRNRSGFPCFYCRSVFDDLPNLRSHQDKVHSRSDIRKSLGTYGAECLVVYVDITDLKCTLCDSAMANLNELRTHLTRAHKKQFHAEYTDRVIPFRLLRREDKYECQICGFTFETFGSIERHMNVHFRNYVCKECGTGFVTKYRLKVHTKSMHVGGTYPCEVCKKVFTTQQKHKNHVDAVHRLVKRFKCPQCPERFSEYFKRQKHIVEVHGGPPLHYKCNVCDKSFDRRYTLSRHMKRDHLEERDYQCQLCAYKCFTKNELRVHMVKHNGERIYECSVCHKSYARKKTLREHMRIHNNDRRFACAVCGQAFVQKCSLKGHIKTHHVDYNLPI